ncbi:MAG: SpoIIE family protein phosphatase [Candidatus Eisenbacteria bacterium]|nr:SpoIIE family protein phosphatase [Candidatus Eisenbacteria bacterium]
MAMGSDSRSAARSFETSEGTFTSRARWARAPAFGCGCRFSPRGKAMPDDPRARILVVDDERLMLRSVVRILEDDYDVQGESSAAAALEAARKRPPQLAILDIQMPGMDGFELLNRLKRQDPRIQVILMTGSLFSIDEKLVRAIREKAFYFIQKPFDREVLLALVARCLELQRLDDSNRRHTRHLEEQLAAARAFQQSMLPARTALLEGFSISADHSPCEALAGDLFDYARVDEGRVAFLIADVAGHGASAAMLTGLVKAAFHASHSDRYDPLSVVARVADGMAAFSPEHFVTLIAARVARPPGSLEYVNAGHDGGLVLTSAAAEPLANTGPMVSPILSHLGWQRGRVAWEANTAALLYTDGVTEAACGDRLFGVERLRSLALASRGGIPRLLPAVIDGVRQFCQGRAVKDDMTLLGIANAGPMKAAGNL